MTPLLKNKLLDVDDVCSYRPVSNLLFLSKVIEKCVHIQIDMYLCENFLYGEFQSAYRSGFSCETALVKISNDILSLLDTKSNAVLLLFDLTAAFDTENHNLLLAKLFENFGFADNALKWFSTYLENRSYYVKGVNDSVSHVVKVTSGVPQGSILGPVLFNLYFKDAEMIAKSHGFSVHSYADDMQCYFELGKNISIDFVSDKITSFLLALKNWMTSNYLKLNKNKTKVIELLPASHNVNARLVTDVYIDSSCALILPTSYVKNLGVIFDAKLTMEKHVHKVVGTCYANLRNLGRIASKLSIDFKIQMVHSMILSNIDYCNALFYDLPEMLLKKLTKVLYPGV